ncbi:hypothetical protein [Craterilacuibacter sp. RT1T]|uniref:hypothetical protein n=1 Tax=Craterilacuibacter sp. RT1T TaxID=2942211 RepID=UPI0020BEAD40|nr:hypothetical protein [Craterilacuibacter sp. RT1T]MCL6262144.1 hypothetical protein [Craterilacuibacter sp. RT1T]
MATLTLSSLNALLNTIPTPPRPQDMTALENLVHAIATAAGMDVALDLCTNAAKDSPAVKAVDAWAAHTEEGAMFDMALKKMVAVRTALEGQR